MGLDLSIYKVERVGNVPFKVLYHAVNDESLNKFLSENEIRKQRAIHDLKEEWGCIDDFVEERISFIEKRYKRYADYAIELNEGYNNLTLEEKEKIAELSSIEHKYYGKNWDLFKLLGHELCGNIFDHETQDALDSLSKETLEKVFKLTQAENPQNKGLSHLQSLLSKGDFEKFHYFISAWY